MMKGKGEGKEGMEGGEGEIVNIPWQDILLQVLAS